MKKKNRFLFRWDVLAGITVGVVAAGMLADVVEWLARPRDEDEQ